MKLKRLLLPIGALAILGMTIGASVASMANSENVIETKATADLVISSDEVFSDFITAVNGGTKYINQLVQLADDVSYEITEKPTADDPWSIFAGEFDGLGHTITITVNMTDATPSLFRNLANTAEFKNVNINYSVISSMESGDILASPIAAFNNGLVQDVHTTIAFNVPGVSLVGGIVEKNQSTGIIRDCSASGSIKGKSKVAGIAAENLGQIINCENNCTIESVSSTYAGGITAINGSRDFVKAKIINCINNGNITASSTDLGGIAAFMYSNSEISYCANYGNVSSTATGTGVGYGGIVGRMNGDDSNDGHITKIEGCYNAGNISSVRNCGGIIGLVNSEVTPAIQINGCLSTGDVNGSKVNAGTFIGWANSNTLSITDSWVVGAKQGTVTKLGIGAGTAAGTSYSKSDGVSADFKDVIKKIREYNCVAIPGFGTLYDGLTEAEKDLLDDLNYYDDLNTYTMKTYGQAAAYINNYQSQNSRPVLLNTTNDDTVMIVVLASFVALPLATMFFVIIRKKYVANK